MADPNAEQKDDVKGAGPQTQVCPKCGHENDRFALRCDACSEILHADAPNSAPPARATAAVSVARVHEQIRLCPQCAHTIPPGAPKCPSCGVLLGFARREIVERQNSVEGYLGVVALVVAIVGMVLFRLGFAPVCAGGVSVGGALLGMLAFKKDQQPGLGIFAIIVGVLGIFMAIMAPVMK